MLSVFLGDLEQYKDILAMGNQDVEELFEQLDVESDETKTLSNTIPDLPFLTDIEWDMEREEQDVFKCKLGVQHIRVKRYPIDSIIASRAAVASNALKHHQNTLRLIIDYKVGDWYYIGYDYVPFTLRTFMEKAKGGHEKIVKLFCHQMIDFLLYVHSEGYRKSKII